MPDIYQGLRTSCRPASTTYPQGRTVRMGPRTAAGAGRAEAGAARESSPPSNRLRVGRTGRARRGYIVHRSRVSTMPVRPC